MSGKQAMRVLVATDGSDDANAAARWVPSLPLPADREVMVVTVVSPPRIGIDTSELRDLHGALVAEARHLADGTAAQLMTTRATGRVVEGDPRDEIVAAAREWNADLVVVGARGLSAISRFFLGSVSLGVAREAACPVLVCRGAPRDIGAITVAIDGSDHAGRALAWLAAQPLPATLIVRLLAVAQPQRLHGSPSALLSPAMRAAMAALDHERRVGLDAELARAANTLKGRVAEVQTVVRDGAPAAIIVEDAERHGSDLIVVGARGLGAMGRLWLGSVSETVLRHATCPVLVVRPFVEEAS